MLTIYEKLVSVRVCPVRDYKLLITYYVCDKCYHFLYVSNEILNSITYESLTKFVISVIISLNIRGILF